LAPLLFWENTMTHDPKMLGAATINSHLEAVRVALMVYGLDWDRDGFADHWQDQLARVATDRRRIAAGWMMDQNEGRLVPPRKRKRRAKKTA
jgi:hypothetical protein